MKHFSAYDSMMNLGDEDSFENALFGGYFSDNREEEDEANDDEDDEQKNFRESYFDNDNGYDQDRDMLMDSFSFSKRKRSSGDSFDEYLHDALLKETSVMMNDELMIAPPMAAYQQEVDSSQKDEEGVYQDVRDMGLLLSEINDPDIPRMIEIPPAAANTKKSNTKKIKRPKILCLLSSDDLEKQMKETNKRLKAFMEKSQESRTKLDLHAGDFDPVIIESAHKLGNPVADAIAQKGSQMISDNMLSFSQMSLL